MSEMSERDTMRWVWRGSALAFLGIGWVFIAWQNHFHITAPVVFVCLGYLAVVATVYNLWRTGASAVATAEGDGDSTWAKPTGARGELEREKRTLLKAIKEAEFDLQMGKLSQRDADDMIRTYRARAVEVLKEIDRLDSGTAGSAREQILREVRARLEIDARSQPSPKKPAEPRPGAKADGSGNGARGRKKPAEPATEPATDAAAAGAAAPATSASDEVAPASAADDAVPAAHAADTADAASDDAAARAAIQAAQAATKAAQAAIDDDAMNADSTTTVEPKRDDPAKEATP
jgi:hypothetical protein